METFIKRIGLLITILIASISAHAYDFEVDGIRYNVVSIEDLTCEVTKGDYSGDMVIPSKVNYKNRIFSVVAIDREAFWGSSLKSIILPNTLKKIGDWAFARADIEEISLGDSITIIGACCFTDCDSLKRIVISSSVSIIEKRAFEGCTSLTNVTLGSSLTSIGERCFKNCSSLVSISIPNSVKEIGIYAFDGCSALENISLSENLGYIKGGLFQGCKSLKSLTIPGSVRYISNSLNAFTLAVVFEGCKNLTELRFPASESPYTLGIEWLNSLKLEKLYIDRKLRWEYGTYSAKRTVKELTIGPNISNLQESDLDCHVMDSLKVVICQATVPPIIDEFSNSQYMNCTLKVPAEAIEAYKKADVWKNFWNIEAIGTSGVEDIGSDSTRKVEVGRYDINGRPVSDGYKGFVIVRFSDGTCEKRFNR